MDKKKEIYSYIRPKRGGYIWGGVFVILSVVAIVFAEARTGGMIGMMLFFVALTCGPTAYREMVILSALKEDEEENNLDALYDEFTTGNKFGNDSVRIGNKYIFGRRCEGYSKISEITKIYQYVHKTNFMEDQRTLRATLNDESVVNLMNLKVGKGNNEDLLKIVAAIIAINPSVTVGYK